MKQFQHIIDKINEFLSEEFEVDIDRSLDYIDLVVVIENNFSFKVKPEDFTGIISFRDFYGYIISRVQLKEPSDAVMAGQVQR